MPSDETGWAICAIGAWAGDLCPIVNPSSRGTAREAARGPGFLNDDEFARTVVGQIREALPARGYLAIYESANTVPANNEAIRIYNQSGAAPYHLRSVQQITRFFDGLQAVEPGIMPIQQWRPDELSAALPQDIHVWGGVAQKR